MAVNQTSKKSLLTSEDPESQHFSDNSDLAKDKHDSESDEHLQERRPSRIAPVRTGSVAESRVSIGKQLELEADNAIKYRTCSWQKVR